MGTLQLQAQDQNFWVFLCFGQSNMAGQAPIEHQDLTVSDRYLSMATTDGADRKLGTWRKAVPPLCRADAHLGPVDWFGRTLLDVVPENVRIGIVSVAVEGCPITFFDKDKNAPLIAKEERDWMNGILNQYGRDPYERLLSMAKVAARDGVIKGILLHQGETDAYNDRWLEKVKKIYGDIISDLNLDPKKVPLVAGEAVGADQNGICAHANPTINRLPSVLPNSYVASSKGCEAGPDHLHFTTRGYRTLGTRYAIKMLQAMGFPITDGYSEQSESSLQQQPVLNVEASLVNNDVLHAVADAPLSKVEYVSFSGNVLKTIVKNGETVVDLDANLFPEERHLVIVFYGQNGATTSVDITR